MRTNESGIKYFLLVLCTVCAMITLVACTGKESGKKTGISNGVDIAVLPTTELIDGLPEVKQDTNDVVKAVILEIQPDKSTITLQQTGTQNKEVYTYTGGTNVVNRYDEIMSVSQLELGEVVDIETANGGNKLTKIKVSDSDWEYIGATDFKIDKENQMLIIGSEKYFYTDNTVIINDGKIMAIDKLESIDVLTLKGCDKQLDSIIVTAGHGYVRLDSTTYFEGGFVEIGQKIVHLITENMVIPVPAGTYTFSVTKDKTSGSKEITVNNDEEIRINLTEFQSDAVRLGTLSFKISPSGAKLTIDGVVKDYTGIIDVAYGTHKIVVSADGYEPYSQIITVEDIFKEYNIALVKASEEETATTTAENSQETTTTKSSSSTSATTATEKQTTAIQTIDYAELMDSLFGN